MRMMTVLVPLLLLKISATFDTFSEEFTKVPSTFLSSFPTCSKLQSRPLPSRLTKLKSLGCLQMCTSTVNCSLACYNGSTCLLSSALVAPYWVPKASVVQTLLPYTGYKCFSSWVFQNDLTSYVTGVKTSPQYSSHFQGGYAVDGYYCDTIDTHFETNATLNNWLEIDMGNFFQIQTIIVKARNIIDKYAFFADVKISVGNETGNGTYTYYTPFGTFRGRADIGQVITFQPLNPIIGQFISFVDNNHEYFVIGEVKVIGHSIERIIVVN